MSNSNPLNQSYQISISLKKGCYRHIRIDGNCSLFDLHCQILSAFNLEDNGLHAFFMDNKPWSDDDAYWADFVVNEDSHAGNKKSTGQTLLSNLNLTKDKRFKYLFDFNNEWVFQGRILQVIHEKTEQPLLIKSVGQPPNQYNYLAEDRELKDNPTQKQTGDKISFPQPYSPTKCRKLYKGLGLTADIIKELHNYFSAFANLYGALPVSKAWAIYNSQNNAVDQAVFLKFAEIVSHDEDANCYILDKADIYYDTEPDTIENHFILDALITDYAAVIEDIELQSQVKSYYIPAKKQLLKYASWGYIEKTPAYLAMEKFLPQVIKKTEPHIVIGCISDIIKLSQSADLMGDISHFLESEKIVFASKDQAETFFNLFMDLSNSTRMIFNLGYTPNELRIMHPNAMPNNITFGPNMTAAFKSGDLNIGEMQHYLANNQGLPQELRQNMISNLNEIAAQAKAEKTGRNEPCPCGSGQKYKRCCGKNHQ